MKILHTVESYYPETGGMAEVVRQLSERLAAFGHEVTVATRKRKERTDTNRNGVLISEFDVDGNMVRGITGEQDSYKNFVLNAKADVITNFAAQQWATDLVLPLLPSLKAKKVFVPTGFSGLYLPEYRDYFVKMKTWMKDYDANIFLSDNYRDINFARENGITQTSLIPNGAAAEEFLPESTQNIRQKLGIKPDDFLLLHVGSYTGIKGQKEAVEIFLESELKNATLLLIGFHNDHYLQALNKSYRFRLRKLINAGSNKKIIITAGLNRAETVAAYKAADLFLFPSNVECSPIVLFECMAARLPFMTTEVGNSKEIIGWCNGGMLLPTTFDAIGYSHAVIKESVKMLNALYRDKEERKRLGENGYTAWKTRFTWEIIAKQYEELYHKLTNNN